MKERMAKLLNEAIERIETDTGKRLCIQNLPRPVLNQIVKELLG